MMNYFPFSKFHFPFIEQFSVFKLLNKKSMADGKWQMVNPASAGFTLLELLVAISVFLTIGAIVVGILASSLRGQTKTNTLVAVRQNGNFAMTQIVKTVRTAKRFDGVSINGASYNPDCSVPIITPTPAPTQYKYFRITTLSSQQITYACLGQSLTANDSPMIDTNIVSVNSCYFICRQTSKSDTPIIDIHFSLVQKSQESLFEAQVQPVFFHSSVNPRNINR